VLGDKAAIFVDGRYTLQVRNQVDTAVFEPVAVHEIPVADWLKANAMEGQRIGYDPWLMTRSQVRQIAKALEGAGAELVPLEANPLDAVWRDRPEPPVAAVTLQPEELAGRPTPKRSRHRSPMPRSGLMLPCSPIPRRSPGCSTSAAATCRAHRSRCPSPRPRIRPA
jgi:hypothetical protein